MTATPKPGDRVRHTVTGALGTVLKVGRQTASVDFDAWTMPGGKHTLPRQTLDAKLRELAVTEAAVIPCPRCPEGRYTPYDAPPNPDAPYPALGMFDGKVVCSACGDRENMAVAAVSRLENS